ncbi:hypothetical protein OE88DRAFT_1656108 [Heliocybe sulcata]|uniref:Uncharacterized protein n=1 Tax=Heliocybe sulcata TaxID=5364 RepID=A0A5C3N9P4_9AGAM|nr:hypothetical protein OE88DRAFT_1656108 [Heliocybe sulcata]
MAHSNLNSIRSGSRCLSPPHACNEDHHQARRLQPPPNQTSSLRPSQYASSPSSPRTTNSRPFPSTSDPSTSANPNRRPHLQSTPTTPRRLPSSHIRYTSTSTSTCTPPLLTRARPTLAMSIQVPRTPTERGREKALSSSSSTSSPRRRSQSRSERLLRDTLRKADAHLLASLPPPPLPSRKGKEREDEGAFRPEFVQRHTAPERNHARKASVGSYSSRSSGTSGSGSGSPGPRLVRSPTCPVLGREKEGEGAPHGAVLRSRLEGVLRGAGVEDTPRAHLPTPAPSPPSETRVLSTKSGSPPREEEAMLTPPPTPPHSHSRARSYTSMNIKSAPASQMYFALPPCVSPENAVTPRPSPNFDAQSASRRCREMTGLVSFRDLEGLGCPEEEEAGEERRGWGWRVFG